MGIDAHVPRSARKGLFLSVGNVLFGGRISVVLRHPKVNQVDGGGVVVSPNQEVVWLDVTIDEVLVMGGLNASQLHVSK